MAISLGKTRMILAILSLYIAAFLESRFIWLDRVREIKIFEGKHDFWLHLSLFFVIYLISFAILNRSTLKHRFTLSEVSVLSLLGIAFFEMGFLATIILGYFPPELTERIPPLIAPYFVTKTAQFIWAALSLLILLAIKRKRSEPIV